MEDIKKAIKREQWVTYYARYDLAILWHRLDGGGSERVMAKLSKAYAHHEHSFDVYLHTRVNMAEYHVRHGPELGLQTDGRHRSMLKPAPMRAEVAAEYDQLWNLALQRVGGVKTVAEEKVRFPVDGLLGQEAEPAAASVVVPVTSMYDAPWWQGINDPPKVTPV